jgi:hypothetical protein
MVDMIPRSNKRGKKEKKSRIQDDAGTSNVRGRTHDIDRWSKQASNDAIGPKSFKSFLNHADTAFLEDNVSVLVNGAVG